MRWARLPESARRRSFGSRGESNPARRRPQRVSVGLHLTNGLAKLAELWWPCPRTLSSPCGASIRG